MFLLGDVMSKREAGKKKRPCQEAAAGGGLLSDSWLFSSSFLAALQSSFLTKCGDLNLFLGLKSSKIILE